MNVRSQAALEKSYSMEGLLTEINRQLSDQGLTIKSEEVSIIDKVNWCGTPREGALGHVSVIEAKKATPTKVRPVNQLKTAKLTGMYRPALVGSVKVPTVTKLI